MFDELFTNIFADGEVSTGNPDAEGDYYLITDAQNDHNYMLGKICDALVGISDDPSQDFQILYGGEVTDGGSGTVDIAECVAISVDSSGNRRLVHLPAQTGASLPSGYNDGNPIWAILKYDFKYDTATRTHRLGTTYHAQIKDSFLGDASSYEEEDTDSLFTQTDPAGACVVLGHFTMTGSTFATITPSDRSLRIIDKESSVSITGDATLTISATHYINATAKVTLTLPASMTLGQRVRVIDTTGYGYRIKPNSGQTIRHYNRETAQGVSDYAFIESNIGFAVIEMVCTTADTKWHVVECRDVYRGKGYYMGGYTSAVVAVIEDMNFSNETSSVIIATLNTAKMESCGVSSNTKGYCMGGFTGSVTAVIEDMNFSDETSNVITATLNTAKRNGAGVSGSTKGYCMGGNDGSSTAVIEDMNFSDETSNVITATLNTAKNSSAGVFGNTKGYCMGGTTGSSTAVIEDMNFSDETSNVITATLNTAKYYLVGVSGSTKGYCMGGNDGTFTAVIEDMNFSDETSNVITATLNTAKYNGTGVSGNTKGYYMGGGISGSVTAVIEDMNFSDETSNVITATLDTAKRNGAGVSGAL